jgi:hypothetical protein
MTCLRTLCSSPPLPSPPPTTTITQITTLDSHRLRLGTVSCGHCYLKFSTHRDALAAAKAMTGLELAPGVTLDVGWADAKDWHKAAPRLPAYF